MSILKLRFFGLKTKKAHLQKYYCMWVSSIRRVTSLVKLNSKTPKLPPKYQMLWWDMRKEISREEGK